MKKIYRSKKNRQVSGVCGGLAEYFNIDPTVVRLIWVLISIASASFPGLLVYFICALVIPEEPDSYDVNGYEYNDYNQE